MSDSLAVEHGFVTVDGVRIHYAETGAGPAVLLCHGFPEIWRSWRHQLPALAAAGYRAIALDMRGHGQSDAPPAIADYTVMQTVGDVIGLMDALGIEKATMVGHDAGTTAAYYAALMRPDRVNGVFGLSVPFGPRPPISPAVALVDAMPPGFYMGYFQQIGVAEADLEADPRETVRRIIYHNSGDNPLAPAPMIVPPGEGLIAQLASPDEELTFLSDADLDAYASDYARTGFRGGLNGYRVFHDNWRLTAPWAGLALPVPSAFVGGGKDLVLEFPGFRDLAQRMGRCTIIAEAGHWVHAERSDEVNGELVAFLTTLD